MSRFQQLENTFELPSLDEIVQVDNTLEQAQALDVRTQHVDFNELHDEEMDEISDLAIEYGKSLHDLGMNVETKHAGEIFTASSNMLKIALDARNSKLEKKLKLMKLEMDKLKMERANQDTSGEVQEGKVKILDRAELLEQLKQIRMNDAA